MLLLLHVPGGAQDFEFNLLPWFSRGGLYSGCDRKIPPLVALPEQMGEGRGREVHASIRQAADFLKKTGAGR